MSDPVESVAIEDVLSSIRRLVSEEPKPRATAEVAAHATPPAPSTDRLVLTPAFRVPDPEQATEDTAALSESSPETAREAYVAEVPESMLDAAEVGADASEAMADVGVSEMPFDPTVGDAEEAPMAWDDNAIEDRVAELEAVVAHSEGDWEPDGEEDDGEDITLRPIEVEEPIEDATADASFFDAQPAGDDAFLDEETLRELVSEIVREELQGDLGQRITRNVRKLVRVEINRALASREFD